MTNHTEHKYSAEALLQAIEEILPHSHAGRIQQQIKNRAREIESTHTPATQTNGDTVAALLREYMETFPAFRGRPIGAPGSMMRKHQEFCHGLEDRAQAALSAAHHADSSRKPKEK